MASPDDPVAAGGSLQRRMLLAGPAVAVATMAAALLTTNAAGVPLRDPDHVAGRRFIWVLGLVGLLILLDIVVRAVQRSGWRPPSPDALGAIRRERWTLGRAAVVLSALISFYLTYLAYRNLKSVVPLLRPGDLFDRQLADLDRSMFAGNDPADLMHDLLGTGAGAHVLSFAYMLFFPFIPVTLAFALVYSSNLRAGLFYVTAQSLNWVLGAASYFVLPSLGPVYYDPPAFEELPASPVTRLQDILLDQRVEFLSDPAAGTAQSIGAFASLHVSIFFTAALAAHLLRLPRPLRVAAWILFGLTVAATVYLGWHYVLDDLGGLVVGALAIVLAGVLTGIDPRSARREPAPQRAPEATHA